MKPEEVMKKVNSFDSRLKQIEDVLFGIKDDIVFRAKVKKISEEQASATSSSSYLNTPATETVTIASGVLSVFQSYHDVETEGAAASDDVDTIDDVNLDGAAIICLRPASSARTIVMKDGTGNLRLNGDFTMDSSRDTITLIGTGGIWYELARSDNDT